MDATRSRENSADSQSSDSPSSPSMSIHAPVPRRPGLPSRKSSGNMVVDRNSIDVGPIDTVIDPDDVRAMSPRMATADLINVAKEARQARDELARNAKQLQAHLLTIVGRIEAVKEEHDKLDKNNRFLQTYIGDLMATSKITAGGRGKK